MLKLLTEKLDVAGLPGNGNLLIDPPVTGLNRVLLRRLYCWLRVAPTPGAKVAYLDTGSPLTVFSHQVWHHEYRWQPGRDFEELSIAGVGNVLRGQVLGHKYSCRLAHLRRPVELAGLNLKAPRLRLDSLVCQLADPGGPPYIILGLWGGVFEGRRLIIDRQANSDDLAAQLEW